jgi:hypothetical protein
MSNAPFRHGAHVPPTRTFLRWLLVLAMRSIVWLLLRFSMAMETVSTGAASTIRRLVSHDTTPKVDKTALSRENGAEANRRDANRATHLPTMNF